MNTHLKAWDINPDDFPTESYASDQLEFLLRYAILAPSTHNTQPWLFFINAMNVDLYLDRRQWLGVVDPEGRELVMSCGAALFNLRVAAEYFGHVYKIEVRPEPNQRDLLARFHLGLQGETTGEDIVLFNAITQRHTNRQAFADRPIPEDLLSEWEGLARANGAWFQVLRDSALRAAVADLVAEGDRLQWADKAFRKELAHWIRSKSEDYGDGLPSATSGIKDWLSFAGPLLIRTFDRGQGVAAADHEIAEHSPVLAVLGTDSDELASWLGAGQALQNILLEARSEDVWASFLNQPVELPELRRRLTETIGCSGYPQVLLRLGYGPEAPPSPRRSLRQSLIMHKTLHPG